MTISKTKYGAVSVLVYSEERLVFEQNKIDRLDLKDNPFIFLLEYMKIGDSCQFMVSADRLIKAFKPLKVQTLKTNDLSVFIKLENVYDEQLDSEMVEQSILKSYLKKSKAKQHSVIYVEPIKPGSGKKIGIGDEITIAYKGYFPNGLEFDNISGKTAFTFTYGSQGQVIKGLEIAIKAMREGQKSKIIIPSQLAFGEIGSTTLIVPPYTTVIYDLEVVKVN